MRISTSMRWLVVVAGAAMLLAVVAACAGETVEVPGETVVVKEEVIKEVQVPGETVVVEKEVIKEVMVPGETVTKEVVKEVMVPGETVVVEKEVVKTVEVPGETVVVEKVMVKEVQGKKYVTDPTTGVVTTAPEYGGTLTFARKQIGEHTDTWFISGWAAHFISGVLEKPSIGDWGIDRAVHDWKTTYVPPSTLTAALAESWETPDDKTVILNIRQGVKWQDKAPMNGRELTAKDIEFNFHRVLGLGSGFTEPSPMAGRLEAQGIESVEATDNWTVVFKLKEPAQYALGYILNDHMGFIYPPEVIEEHGDVKDWRNVVGTGPFMLTDYVEGSSITWKKNPNYWGFDPKYPENRIPYIDEARGLFMDEAVVFIAALRSAKIDFVGVAGDSQLRSIDQVESLKKTNPELVILPTWYRSDNSFMFSVEKKPFDDIRVRRAMQMGLDLETINSTYFKGYANTTPTGRLAADLKGWSTPFEEWPEEVKKYYTYDPEGAKQLLAEAGFPDGFKTILNFTARRDPNWMELTAVYWREIGIQIEIRRVDAAQAGAMKNEGTFEGFWAWNAGNRAYPPPPIMKGYLGGSPGNWMGTSEPEYDAMYNALVATTDLEEQKRLVREMGMYAIEKHWQIWGPESPQFNVHQPWIKGYNGEITLGAGWYNPMMPYVWIDSEMKKEMGH